ncbi:hypothetical protein VQ056_27045 [Paenibacillus sp. JTLBN-2024]
MIAEGSAFHARSISTLANSRHRPPIRIEHDFLGADAANSGKLWILDRGRPFYVTAWIEGRPMQTAQDFEQLGRL